MKQIFKSSLFVAILVLMPISKAFSASFAEFKRIETVIHTTLDNSLDECFEVTDIVKNDSLIGWDYKFTIKDSSGEEYTGGLEVNYSNQLSRGMLGDFYKHVTQKYNEEVLSPFVGSTFEKVFQLKNKKGEKVFRVYAESINGNTMSVLE